MSCCSFSGGEEYKNHFQAGEFNAAWSCMRRTTRLTVVNINILRLCFSPLRYIYVLWMWPQIVFQHIKVWALFSLASVFRNNPRGQCVQTPWSMGTSEGSEILQPTLDLVHFNYSSLGLDFNCGFDRVRFVVGSVAMDWDTSSCLMGPEQDFHTSEYSAGH